jgi:oligopeptide/dipeptide ABC transporter ATP-binding protein
MNILDCTDLRKHFRVGSGSWLPAGRGRRGAMLHAVDDVTFSIGRGESVGLVGESGCGKSTLVRLITRMLDPTAGDIVFDGRNIGYIPARLFPAFSVPAEDPDGVPGSDRQPEPPPHRLRHHSRAAAAPRASNRPRRARRRVMEAAGKVGLPPELLPRYPHQLSGGQKARVGIARAVSMSPALLVLDEPTAALDVSVQATILKLLADLKSQLGMSYLFVSHDLNVVRMLCDRVIVMYLGRIVEQGPTDLLFRSPAHPYTRALVKSIPVICGRPDEREALAGEPQSPIDPDPKVCRFFGRCPRQRDRCRTERTGAAGDRAGARGGVSFRVDQF